MKKRKTRRIQAKGCCGLNGAHNSSFFSLFSAFVVHLHCSALPDLLSDLCFKEGMMEVEDNFSKLISRAMRTLLLFLDLNCFFIYCWYWQSLPLNKGWLVGRWVAGELWGTTVSWLLLIALPCSTPCLPSIHICISSAQNSGFRERMIGRNRKTSSKPCYTQSFRLPQSYNCRKGRELTASLSNLHSRHWYSRSWNALNSIIIN